MFMLMDPLSPVTRWKSGLSLVKSWSASAFRFVRNFALVAVLILVSLGLSAFTRPGRVILADLNDHLNPDKLRVEELARRLQAEQLASIRTLNRGVFRTFIQMNNMKIYDRLQEEIIDACIVNANKYRLSPVLVLSLIQVESGFNINATSSKGAIGLTQVNPADWLEVLIKQNIVTSISDCYDPRKNIEAGCFILRHYLDEAQDFEVALDKYLGTRSDRYRNDVHEMANRILMLGISTEIQASYNPIFPGSRPRHGWN